MIESGFIDEAPRDRGGLRPAGSRPKRGRRWVLPILFVVAVVILPAFAAWVHFGRVHAEDVAAFEELVQEFDIIDRTLLPLSHGSTAPCEASTEGQVTRAYSRLAGPNALEVRNALLPRDWTLVDPDGGSSAAPSTATSSSTSIATSIATSESALFRLERPSAVKDHEYLVLLVADSPAAQGVQLTATSSASALGCLLRR